MHRFVQGFRNTILVTLLGLLTASANSDYGSSLYSSPSEDAQCDSLRERAGQIDARMRVHYGVRQGHWLRGHRHELSDRLFELHCTL